MALISLDVILKCRFPAFQILDTERQRLQFD